MKIKVPIGLDANGKYRFDEVEVEMKEEKRKLYKYKTQFSDEELIESEWCRKANGSLYRRGYRIEVDHISQGWFQWGRTIWYYYVPENTGGNK